MSMATDGTTEESTSEQPADPALEDAVPSLEERAQRAADLVEEGLADLDDLTAHEHADRTDEEIQEAVEAELARRQDNDASVVQEPDDEPEATITSADGVDWTALWQEFGFDTPNAAGSRFKSATKVYEALRVTDQPVTGDVDKLVTEAVENGTLRKITTETERGESILKGYILAGDGQ